MSSMRPQRETTKKFKIGNLWVRFPYVPYSAQEEFMKRMIESLENGTNALLESPTGTGKTLCLLCASLAWLDSKRKEDEIPEFKLLALDSEVDDDNLTSDSQRYEYRKIHRVFFCTRTHSQLMQAVKEMNNSAYGHLRSSVLGSRRHLCLNPIAKQSDNLDNMCRALRTTQPKDPRTGEPCSAPSPDIEDLPKKCGNCLQDHKCPYYVNYEKMISSGQDHVFTKCGALDQRKLIAKSKKYKVCPVYVSRHLLKRADIVFLPYTYVFNPHILRAFRLNIRDAVLIIDEGHNIEKVCEENASFEMKVSDISNSQKELSNCCKFFHDQKYHDRPTVVCEKDVLELIQIMRKLEHSAYSLKEGKAENGQFCQEMFADAGFTNKESPRLLYSLHMLIQYCGAKEEKAESMRKMENIVSTVFEYSDTSVLQNSFVLYKEIIKPEEKNRKEPKEPKIFFWCFDAGVMMKSLQENGVHSFIVTSGTLSPLEPLKKSLAVPFEVELINKHVIDSSQLLSICVEEARTVKDDRIVPLRASWKNREKDGEVIYEALGNLVQKVAEVSPKGLLLFFPSRKVKDDCLKRWDEVLMTSNKRTLYDVINDHKVIFIEPKESCDLPKLQELYSSKINEPGSKGAFLIGVSNGKVSEGIDFKDDLGRTVIMVGLPYPPLYDPWVLHKREYLRKMKDGETSSSEWYLSQAIRPVNQALGRIIRHQEDYGAVILADLTYSMESGSYNYRVYRSLPAWLRQNLLITRFEDVKPCLEKFFSGIGGQMKKIKRKAEEQQFEICERHRKILKTEEYPSNEYRKLLEMREEERAREQLLIQEVEALRKRLSEKSNEIEKLKEEVTAEYKSRELRIQEESMVMAALSEAGNSKLLLIKKEFDSDCESNGESEWDEAVPSCVPSVLESYQKVDKQLS